MRVHSQSIVPREMAEMNVPAKANVKILPMLWKKLACPLCQYAFGMSPVLFSNLV
jgi:hypothetical protein